MVERPSSSRGDVALDGVVAYDRGSPVCLRSLFTIVDVLRQYTFSFRLATQRGVTREISYVHVCLPKVRVVVLCSFRVFEALCLRPNSCCISFLFLALGPHLNVASSRSSCAIGVPGVRVCGCGDNFNRVVNVYRLKVAG